MFIHSVMPAHLLIPNESSPVSAYRQIGNSYLEGEQTPQGFRLYRIHSTDPAMYLREGFTPGSWLHP